MAVLIIALFVIVVVWSWYLVPKRTGAHKSSTLNVRGRRLAARSPQPAPEPKPNAQVGPVAPPPTARVAAVPGRAVSGASVRRRRVRTFLVGAAIVSLAVALYTGSINWWFVHMAIDALLILHYGLTLQLQENRAVRAAPAVAHYQEESPPVLRKVVGG